MTASLENIASKGAKQGIDTHLNGDESHAFDDASHIESILAQTFVGDHGSEVSEELLRLVVAQGLWGEGYLGPGSPELLAKLIIPLQLSNEKNLGIIGFGLGGAARHIARETEVKITGYERRSNILAEALRQFTAAGLKKNIAVKAYKPNSVRLPKEKFDGVIAFQELSLVENKERLIKQVYRSLKPAGTFVLTDYVIANGDFDQAKQASCFSGTSGQTFLCSPEEYTATIEKSGFNISVQEDITSQPLSLIVQGWAGWRQILKAMIGFDSSSVDEASILRVLGEQATEWANRLDALNKDDLAVYQFVCRKPA